jgi:hypothetical protein
VEIEADIVERVRQDFAEDSVAEAITALNESDARGRVARCIVIAANGSLSSLQSAIELGKYDWRDAIVAGEYVNGDRVRDLRVSFLIDHPNQMWVGEVAVALHERGMELRSVATRPAPLGPFHYVTDRSEGEAVFASPMFSIRVEKKDRHWRLHDEGRDLEIYGLNRFIENETEFRDAVQCYLLVRDRPPLPIHPASP